MYSARCLSCTDAHEPRLTGVLSSAFRLSCARAMHCASSLCSDRRLRLPSNCTSLKRSLLSNSLPREFEPLISPNPSTKKIHHLRWTFWWALRGSNSRPSRCKRDALPAELSAHRVYIGFYTLTKINNQELFSFFLFLYLILLYFAYNSTNI